MEEKRPSPEILRFLFKNLLAWFEKNRRNYVWRNSKDLYVIFISEFLLQKTSANRVAKFLPDFLVRYPNFESLTTAQINELQSIVGLLGLAKRALWIKESAIKIIEDFGNNVPSKEEELTSLKGVGKYTARAILTFGYKKDVGIVDANVKRLYSRFFGLPDDYSEKSYWSLADEVIPINYGVKYNMALLDFSALVCKPKPQCDRCLIKKNVVLTSQGRRSNITSRISLLFNSKNSSGVIFSIDIRYAIL
ncbi:MAG: A/G-specific adenine glycosylase [Candidatus Heimdallarchaeota archaeon]|nr:A/G-specific adenine glycosylase [Candidatus Heimdallarchaeota archaeon]